jgi:hypothetical protein
LGTKVLTVDLILAHEQNAALIAAIAKPPSIPLAYHGAGDGTKGRPRQ